MPASGRDAAAWLFLGLVGFAVGQLLALLFVSVVAAALGELGRVATLTAAAEPPGWVVVAELLGLWVGFLGAVVVASRTRGTGRVARDMGLAIRPGDLVVGGAIGVACQLVLIPVLYLPLRALIPHLDRRLSTPAKHLTGGFHGPELALIGFLTVAVVPVVEELLFRGLVLRALLRLAAPAGRVLGPVLAVVGTGILFGLAHAEPLELLGLAVLGMVLAALAWRTGRLGPSMAAHGAFNLVAIVTLAFGTAGVPGLWR
ncbi:lysostaphin resistance A-like protein [Aciditerrimonas ferrireducens]|uniref:Lysostaphin resistance A-like protein n=1 Tax=Aciditerrimonas ferrireducens TaxID=667306 RepID=A0ABV6C5E4_9ACTN